MADTDTAEQATAVSTEVDTEAPAPEEVEPTDTTDEDQGDEGDTFPRSYVEKLRAESARYRERARNADAYAERLHTELVRATGRLADPTDVPFDENGTLHPGGLPAK